MPETDKPKKTIGRAGKIFLCVGLVFIVASLGANHPVSTKTHYNIAYHAAAFIATLLLWGALAFVVGGVVFKYIKNPPPWAGPLLLAVMLVAATYARLQLDMHLRDGSHLNQLTIQDYSSDNSR